MLFTLRAEQSSFKFVPDKFSQQLKKVTRKGRHYAGRPVKSTGLPLRHDEQHAAPELTHEKHVGSDMLAQKAHVTRHAPMAWLM